MIQVQCSECRQSLMASEEQAGTMIPCRHCGAWVRVPGTAPGGAESTEAPCPLCGQSILIEAGDIGMPISCPHCTRMIEVARHPATGQLVLQPGESAVPGEPIPWENRTELGALKALWLTFKETAFSPTDFFRRLRPYGLGDAILYLVIIGLIVGASSILQQSSWHYVMQELVIRRGGTPTPPPVAPSFSILAYAIMILVIPLVQVLAMFIVSALSHLALMVLGGANKGYENTCRVISYANGVNIFGLIPICGGFIGGIWMIVVATIGLRETNRTSTGRALLAILAPTILVLLCACGGIFAVLGLVAAAGSM